MLIVFCVPPITLSSRPERAIPERDARGVEGPRVFARTKRAMLSVALPTVIFVTATSRRANLNDMYEQTAFQEPFMSAYIPSDGTETLTNAGVDEYESGSNTQAGR